MCRNFRLDGDNVYLEEIHPKYFSYIIEWRNNKENNRFLNQPYVLTLELQNEWYQNKYLKDRAQGFFVAIEKKNDEPFATIGWTNYNAAESSCICGRLLVGNKSYRGSSCWIEAVTLFNRYLYEGLKVSITYAHVSIENIPSIKWHEKWGFKKNDSFKYMEERIVNGMIQEEYYRTYEMYLNLLDMRQK